MAVFAHAQQKIGYTMPDILVQFPKCPILRNVKNWSTILGILANVLLHKGKKTSHSVGKKSQSQGDKFSLPSV